jgi:1-acyl-sn-glycerol-3-phosphate acyltransferase
MSGSVAATAYAVWKTFAISLPTMFEGALGRISPEVCDERLRGWSQGIVERAQVRVQVTGIELAPRDRACVLMSNHQSHLDVPILFSVWPGRLRMVAKAELFRVPVFGPATR